MGKKKRINDIDMSHKDKYNDRQTPWKSTEENLRKMPRFTAFLLAT